ncbi:MAG: hypothetical protein ACJA2Q_000606 [Pseudohongiellaceae bacterium]|jgi:uncharacterized protein YdbL (DUF1318 family)
MRTTLTPLFSLILCLLIFPTAAGLTLQEAKEDGIIGERRDGYVGFVISGVAAEVQEMVQDVNRQRRERYQQIAQQNRISVEQVSALAYDKAVEATQSGHYLQDQSGAWVKK